jgi:hypothetical protein
MCWRIQGTRSGPQLLPSQQPIHEQIKLIITHAKAKQKAIESGTTTHIARLNGSITSPNIAVSNLTQHHHHHHRPSSSSTFEPGLYLSIYLSIYGSCLLCFLGLPFSFNANVELFYKQGVSHTGALPFTLKSILRQKKIYENSNISPCKNI